MKQKYKTIYETRSDLGQQMRFQEYLKISFCCVGRLWVVLNTIYSGIKIFGALSKQYCKEAMTTFETNCNQLLSLAESVYLTTRDERIVHYWNIIPRTSYSSAHLLAPQEL